MKNPYEVDSEIKKIESHGICSGDRILRFCHFDLIHMI